MPRNLIPLIDTGNREFLVVADHVVSFKARPSKKITKKESFLIGTMYLSYLDRR